MVYETSSLQIKKITEQSFVHITFLETEDFGKVACNGMVIIHDKEAVVLETPVDNQVSEELITWIENEQQAVIKAVIVHHFHIDCLGGLGAFHQKKISSFANQLTIDLATQKGYEPPVNAIVSGHRTTFGKSNISSHYFGPAHTEDNIVSYFEDDQILFGGCMIKSMGAKRGNIADANVNEWSNSVSRVKSEHPEISTVVPGHGKEGGPELLDYTIDLFRMK